MSITIEIPGFRKIQASRMISDFTGTLAFAGRLHDGVVDRLQTLKSIIRIDVVTSDSFGTAQTELDRVPLTARVLLGEDGPADEQKRAIALSGDPRVVVAFGNGRNDRLLLQTVKEAGGLAVAVDNGEGCALEAILNSDLVIFGAENALDLVLDLTRTKATLRL